MDKEKYDLMLHLKTADKFKKAAIKALLPKESVPLVIVWFDIRTKKLNYSLGSGAYNATPNAKSYLLQVLKNIIERIMAGKESD